MKPRKSQTIRNPFAYEKAQRAKARKHQARIAKIADRLVAIIRDKHDGDMTAHGMPQAWILLNEGGALKPDDGRRGDVSRQSLVEQALQHAISCGRITSHGDGSGRIILSAPRHTPPTSPDVVRVMAIEHYEEVLPYISGRHFADLRRWGEAV